jgi:alanine racemase
MADAAPPGQGAEAARPLLEIDLAALAANWRRLDGIHRAAGGRATGAAVKANGYGVGLTLVAPALADAGCRQFFTATPEEALSLADLLPGVWIACLNGCPSGLEAAFTARSIRPALNSLADLDRWRDHARHRESPCPALLHVDTGMSRLGLDAAEFRRLRERRDPLDGVALDYVMTHLVSAESAGAEETVRQRRRIADLRAAFPDVPLSIANSAGIFLGAAMASDLARPGYALYGGNPTPAQTNPMQPVVFLSAPVLQVRDIEEGETVGYGATWRASRPSRIATLGIGYADGLPRCLGNRTMMLAGERKLPVVGRISMDLATLDVTDAPDIAPGSRIEVLSAARGVDALASDAGTIGYEILTALGPRYRRVVKSV